MRVTAKGVDERLHSNPVLVSLESSLKRCWDELK
jgi:hypothetical protein